MSWWLLGKVGGSTRLPYPLSDGYTRGPIRCLYPMSDDHIRRVIHTTQYPEDMTKYWRSKTKKGMVHNSGSWQVFIKIWEPIYFLQKGYHTQTSS